ncbi:hypothetical protein [Synechococcus sp. UW140]|uniref:hypothetical protein n=1 Tax=Synechococcus sp. UW140 TaxID=368503 RepID=UPI0025D66113|nr:hypothetical protein [Synechococcus sp. UW140]
MTNFQPEQKATGLALVTPERALLLLPVLAGVVVTAVIAGLALVPLAGTLQELDKLEKERITKRDALAEVVRAQGRLFQQQARSKAQKMKLLQLVAGDRSLATLLSQLSVEAAKAGVTLESYEPQTAATKSGADPLLGEGIKKDQQLLVVQGSYPKLLIFLRRLEWLTPLLVISDLSLEGQKADPKAAAITTLKFTLTAYYKALVQP